MTLRIPQFCLALIGSALCACSSHSMQRAQSADGLLGFIFDYPGPDIVPVERVSKAGGQIVTAHAVADGQQLRVSGLVQKSGLHDPPYGSHIDVVVVDPRGKVIASTATTYNPRHFPPRIRGNMGNSHYIARLPAIPPAGSTVQVVFHGAKESECSIHRASAARRFRAEDSSAAKRAAASAEIGSLVARAFQAAYRERLEDPRASASLDEMDWWPCLSRRDAYVQTGLARATRLLPQAKELSVAALRELLREHHLDTAGAQTAVKRIAQIRRITADTGNCSNAFVCPCEPETIYVGTVLLASWPSDEAMISLLAHELTHVADDDSGALSPLFARVAKRARTAVHLPRLNAARARELTCDLIAVKAVRAHIARTGSHSPRARRATRAIAHNCVERDELGPSHLSARATLCAVLALEPDLAREILGEPLLPLPAIKTMRGKL